MSFIPDDFHPPREVQLPGMQLVVLAPSLVVPDLEAVRRSAADIRGVFGPDNGWPEDTLSFEENLDDLVRHEQEFDQRIAFAYTLLAPAADDYLGCLYVRPIKSRLANDARRERFQGQAFLWITSGQALLGDAQAYATLSRWLADTWPLPRLAWPGRSPDWATWTAMARHDGAAGQ